MLLISFLATIFDSGLTPLSYQGFSFLVSILTAVQFVLIYIVIRRLIRGSVLSLIGIFLMLTISLLATRGFYQAAPSVGPLRFGLGYIFILLETIRVKSDGKDRLLSFLQYSLIGLASIWSFEAFSYLAFAFYGLLTMEGLFGWPNFWSTAKSLAKKALLSVLFIIGFQLSLAILIVSKTGQLPRWNHYLWYILQYSKYGLGAETIDPLSAWFVFIAIYFAIIITYMIKRVLFSQSEISPGFRVIVGVSLLGIGEFTYFLGRSHPNNLFHISIPLVIVFLFILQSIGDFKWARFRGLKRTALFFSYCAIALSFISFLPSARTKLPHTLFPFVRSGIFNSREEQNMKGYFYSTYSYLTTTTASSQKIADAVTMIGKYSPDGNQVVVFLQSNELTEVMWLSEKSHVFPISHPVEDAISPPVSSLIINYPAGLKIDDVIFVDSDPRQLAEKYNYIYYYREVQLILLRKICLEFGLQPIEETSTGISAMRLQDPGDVESSYCIEVQKLNAATFR